MAESIIPPPIVQSTYNPMSIQSVSESVIVDRPSPSQDRQSELEADLQFLLDAQSEGLLRGLEGGLADDCTSTGSTTPTAQSVRSASARRTARPIRSKPGLRSARKGIYNSIVALSTVKDDELQDLDEDVRQKEQALEQIDEWEVKKKGLQDATKRIDSNEDTTRVQRLHQEADTLQEEINHVELQLADMKARHRKLVRQATSVENTVQAKMASYTSSLRMLEEDVQKFLSLKPAEGTARPRSQDGQKPMYQVPPKRRTLEMARQQYNQDREAVVQHRESVQHEKAALEEGAAVWKEVVGQVTDFERRLRNEMTNLSTHLSTEIASNVSPRDEATKRLRDLLDHMDRLAETLNAKLELAIERNWNLLIAAIGAEVHALKEGKQLLANVLEPSSAPAPISSESPESGHSSSGSGNEIHELDKDFESTRRPPSNGTESEDDPDPELLFSKPDTDTE